MNRKLKRVGLPLGTAVHRKGQPIEYVFFQEKFFSFLMGLIFFYESYNDFLTLRSVSCTQPKRSMLTGSHLFLGR